MIRSTVTLTLLCPLLALACDPGGAPERDLSGDSDSPISPRSNQVPAACLSLTPAALEASVDMIDEATAEIDEYLATTPQSAYYPNEGYNVAGTISHGQAGAGRTRFTDLQAYLTSINHGDPFVSWEGAAQVTFDRSNEAAHLLHDATWWAYVGMAYDKKETARQAGKRASEAQELAGDLGRQALLCAMERHFNCGDGVVDGGEACDDGDLIDGDGCSSTCQLDAGTCGDGIVDAGEDCDDGNDLDNDGCDRCAATTPWPLDPEDPWEALTPAAVQRSVDLVESSIAQIEAYIAETPQSNYYPNAGYNVAGTLALGYLNQARTTITAHQTYLTSNGYGAPHITSEGVAQNHYVAMRDAADALYHGMWWAYLGAGYDHKHTARMAAQEAVAAQRLADHLARQALLSTMSRYALCSDGVVNGTEACDDGNLVAGDGCSSACTIEAVCGDGVVAGAEACDDGNSDDGDRCSNACVIQACPAGDVKGLWVWNDYVNLANDAADAAELLDFARSKGVTRLFFDVWDEEAGATLTATPAGRQTLAGLIADADARCLEVDLLIGPKGDTAYSEMQGWMDEGGGVAAAIAFAEDAVEFTAGLSGPKPVGIHLDIEPSHAPDKDSNMPGVVARLIDRLYAITGAFEAAQTSAGTSLRINADANVWLQHHQITRAGVTKAAHVWLLDRLDATFMDYVDNSSDLIDYVLTELNYASGVSDRQVIVGVETMRPVLDGWGEWSLDPSATFFEDGEAAMGGALDAVVDHYANNPSLVGTAIHYYDSLRRLSPGPMRLAIPSYIYPDIAWEPNSDWFPALDSVGPGGILMINPQSGPGVELNSDYVAITAAIKGEGIFALGYVSTAYGARSKAAVIADINKYYDWYRPSGIFLDEAPGTGSCAAKRQHYLDLAAAIRERDGSALVVANPGTDTCASYLDFIDVLVTFEESATAYANYTPPAWTAEHAPTRFWHLVHGAGQLGSLVTTAAQRNAGWVYITDDLYEDDPWDNLASYITAEAAQVAGVVLP